jgi:cellobiose phosphorylase
MLRVALESVLGFQLVGGRAIHLPPRLPGAWPVYRIRYRVPGALTRYDIEVSRGTAARLSARIDDEADLQIDRDVVVIPLNNDRGLHRVRVLVPVS